MKFLLCLLLAAPPAAEARPAPPLVRVYSLYKLREVALEPSGGSAYAAGRAFSGRLTARAAGSLILLGDKRGRRELRTFTANGGVWLSGKGVPRRLYIGNLRFSAQKGQLKIINSPPLEEYIAGVVSMEVSDLTQFEAYKAQAVAARTYTLKHTHNHSGEGYQLCDSAHCQVYAGAAAVRPLARAAAEATRGEILLYRGRPAETYYHSVCGGRTADVSSVWPVPPKPYLVSVKDGPSEKPYCSIAPDFRWKTKIYFTGLTRLAREAGWIVSDEKATGLRITEWGSSGRAERLELRTQRRTVSISATDFYHGIGRRAGWRAVRSTWFHIITGKDYVFLDGRGSGHGVGMCQWGAEGMARLGFKYRDILSHYYPGTTIGHD